MDWSALLPPDVWSLVGSKLDTAADRIRFRAVSKEFTSYLPFHQLIFLILPEEEEELDVGESMRVLLDEDGDYQPEAMPPPPRRRFIAVGEQQVHHLDLPEAHEKRCVCSAGSWLVTVDEGSNVCLLNPFTRRVIDLPSQLSLEGDGFFGIVSPLTLMNGFLRKVVFSSLDFTSDDWVAMAIYHSMNRVAICKPGDASWTVLYLSVTHFDDIIFFQGQFFIVDTLGAVYTYDADTRQVVQFSTRVVENFSTESTFRWYLAEWMGELLLVYRVWPRGFPSPPQKTIRFLICKRDRINNQWVKLNDLGDYCLFIGLNTSTCIPISSYTVGTLERNCVYFSANRYHPSDYARIGIPMDTDDIGVYSLKTRSIRYFYDGISSPSCSPPIWIIPTLLSESVNISMTHESTNRRSI